MTFYTTEIFYDKNWKRNGPFSYRCFLYTRPLDGGEVARTERGYPSGADQWSCGFITYKGALRSARREYRRREREARKPQHIMTFHPESTQGQSTTARRSGTLKYE